jgi:hypothetical protein
MQLHMPTLSAAHKISVVHVRAALVVHAHAMLPVQVPLVAQHAWYPCASASGMSALSATPVQRYQWAGKVVDDHIQFEYNIQASVQWCQHHITGSNVVSSCIPNWFAQWSSVHRITMWQEKDTWQNATTLYTPWTPMQATPS